VLEYVVKNAKIDIFERNQAGDTPLTIVQALQNQRAIEIFEDCQDLWDDTAKKTDELMAELMGEDEKNEKARQKRKEKKHRSKLQKLAEKHQCTIEQLETVFKEQEEQKKREEKEQELAVLRAEQEAERAVQCEREERLAAIER